ncbi:MAG TPA: MFS transporter [Pseudolysinimonas sp.]|nr:MFS transporter [Pseudolysinimonas sp.]
MTDSPPVIPRRQVFSWALWDWATQPFNTVILSFIFVALYLTTDAFLPPEIAALGKGSPRYEAGLSDLATQLGAAITIAGFLIAVLAPVLGQRTDASGRRKRSLAISTGLLVVSMALMLFVQAAPAFFVLGIALVAAGTVVSEIAGVTYNAMLVQVSTPRTIGRVSGLGWGFGYLGGIVALVLVVVAYAFDWFGLATEQGLPFRLVALGSAIWTVLFSLPIFLNVPESTLSKPDRRVPFFASYALLVQDVRRLFRENRATFWFLLASAVFRDGLAGVFTFGAVIAAQVFGFGFLDVVIFGIAANLLAGLSTIVSGRFDDRFGPRAVIVTALSGLVATGLGVFFLHDAGVLAFWVGGLLLTLFVGPAQAASRSLLARLAPHGREGEVFGLYATTGRAASFLSPGLWTAFLAIFGATYWGILGIVIVIAAGLILMLLVKLPAQVRTHPA